MCSIRESKRNSFLMKLCSVTTFRMTSGDYGVASIIDTPTGKIALAMRVLLVLSLLASTLRCTFGCHLTSDGHLATFPGIPSATFNPSQAATALHLMKSVYEELHIFVINGSESHSCQGVVKKIQVCYWVSHVNIPSIPRNSLFRFFLLDKVNLQISVRNYFNLNFNAPSCSPASGAQTYICCELLLLSDAQQFQIGPIVVFGLEINYRNVGLLLLQAVTRDVGNVEYYQHSGQYQGSAFQLTHQNPSKYLPLLRFHIDTGKQSSPSLVPLYYTLGVVVALVFILVYICLVATCLKHKLKAKSTANDSTQLKQKRKPQRHHRKKRETNSAQKKQMDAPEARNDPNAMVSVTNNIAYSSRVSTNTTHNPASFTHGRRPEADLPLQQTVSEPQTDASRHHQDVKLTGNIAYAASCGSDVPLDYEEVREKPRLTLPKSTYSTTSTLV